MIGASASFQARALAVGRGLDESVGAGVERTYGDANGVRAPSWAHSIPGGVDGDTTGLDSRAPRSLLAAPSGARESQQILPGRSRDAQPGLRNSTRGCRGRARLAHAPDTRRASSVLSTGF